MTDQSLVPPGPRVHTPSRLESLTSLRFVAALLVFGFHAFPILNGASREGASAVFGAGHAGVSFFFILSGFVLAWSHRPADTAKSFWWRRVARLYPAYLVALAVPAVLVAATGDFEELARGAASPFLLQAWIPDPAYYFAVNNVLWSLSVEAFFYLVFPLMIGTLMAFGKAARRLLLIGMVTAIFALATYGQIALGTESMEEGGAMSWIVRTLPLSRLPEFIIGAILAIELRNGNAVDIGIGKAFALMVGTWLILGWFPSAFAFVALPLIPTALLIMAAAKSDLDGRSPAFRNKSFVKLGAWSYCFYLIHVVVLRIFEFGLDGVGYGPSGTPAPLQGWPVWIAALGLSILGAWMLHRLVEVPADRKLRNFAASR